MQNYTLQVKKLPKAELSYCNGCFNSLGNRGTLVKLVDYDVVYPLYYTEHINSLPEGLYMSDVIRKHHNIQPETVINVVHIKNDYSFVNSLTLHILKKNLSIRAIKKDDIINLHENDITSLVRRDFSAHYFSKNQTCLIAINSNAYTLTVTKIVGGGYVNDSTKISIETNDAEINLVSAKLLRRELFQDDFNFETIGIGGLSKELILIFREALCTRAYKPEIIEKLGIKHVKGILLYGPPGTGKTLIARNISKIISPLEPIVINGPELLNKYVGASEENVRKIFSRAEDDYSKNGINSMLHVIVFDEIDAICKTRGSSGSASNVTDSMVNQMLTKIEGYNELPNIFIIAMTNRKELIDPALLRPGRIEKHVKIGLPNKEGRKEIFRVHTKKMQLSGMLDQNIDFDMCADFTENYNGSEIEAIVKCAVSLNLHSLLSNKNSKNINENSITITMKNILDAINSISTNMNNSKKFIMKHLPNTFKIQSKSYERALNSLTDFIVFEQDTRLKTALLYGDNKCGKTTLMSYVISNKNIKSVKILSAIDFINKNDYEKNEILMNTMFDLHLSDESLLVLDDIDIIVNYAKFGYNINYSNSIFQTLKTILKTVPDNHKNRIIVVCICSELSLKLAIENLFDSITSIDLEIKDKSTILEDLEIKDKSTILEDL